MKLYSYWRSSSAWRVRIALAWKGIPYELVPVRIAPGDDEQHGAAFRAKNPLGEVPLLELDAVPGERPRLVGQSLAILELLEELYPRPALLPSDPWLRARARQLALIVISGIQPLQNLATLQRVKALGADERAFAAAAITRGLAAFERETALQAGLFSVGDEPSFADVCLIPQLYNARRYGVDLDPYPTVLRIEARCQTLPSFQSAEPARQPKPARDQ